MGRRLLLHATVGGLTAVGLAVPLSAGAGPAGPAKDPAGGFQIGLIGDTRYTDEQRAKFPNLVAELNSEDLAFVVHDGDIKGGGTACLDEVYSETRAVFDGFAAPLIYTPGDNEWTDCHREPNPSPPEADPLDRLALLRRTFFADDRSLGQRTLTLERQAGYPENARWSRDGVVFATLHVVGSNDNLPADTNAVGDESEHRARTAANLAWLTETFDRAEADGAAGVMLVIQANIFEEDVAEPSGFSQFKAHLERETVGFGKPVVLVHGDSHYFRVDKPLLSSSSGRRIERFTRVETFGTDDVHWVRVVVDPDSPDVFSFHPEIVDANLVAHGS